MAIKQLTPQKEIEAYMRRQVENREKAIIYKLASIGEEVVNFAKNTRGYTDRTGNLVSSTGFILVKNGKIINGGKFEQTGQGAEGQKNGEKFAKEIAAQMPQGIGIIVVAGMSYAGYVEATGRNVLALSEIQAKQLVIQMINQLGLKMR